MEAPTEQPPLVIYHGNCVDGMGAGWVAWSFFDKTPTMHKAQYGDMPPDVTGRDVYIVDFSYPLEALQFMATMARSITVIDHHKTAQEALASLPQGVETYEDRISCPLMMVALFDMERSGAGMTWDFFHPGEPRPSIIDHIEDRDLWRFAHPDTRAIHAALASYPMDNFQGWGMMIELGSTNSGHAKLVDEGTAIDRRHLQMVHENIKVAQRSMNLGGYTVPVVNAPFSMASDTGNILAQGHAFGATYIDLPRGRSFSLRSTDHGVDVSEIAKKYGGGGHRNAAGFSAAPGWEGEPADGKQVSTGD